MVCPAFSLQGIGSRAFKPFLEGLQTLGVISASLLAVKRWISKDVSRGGFGGSVGSSILTDKDLSLSMSMGVSRDCGAPARVTFIIDWTGTVRYMMVHKSDIGRSVKEILRLVQAFRHSDFTGVASASGWIPGGEVFSNDSSKKVEYFVNKFGHGNKEKTDDGNENTEENDATATAKIEASPERKQPKAPKGKKSQILIFNWLYSTEAS
jgi:peroxiredoxin (alkyl hydroperoxide reductase subunit C)